MKFLNKLNKTKYLNTKLSAVFLLALFLFQPLYPVKAQTDEDTISFKAEVIEIIEEEEKQRIEDNTSFIQQNLRLEALDGERIGEEFIYYGISDIEVATVKTYQEGDEVFVDVFQGPEGEEIVYVTEYDRSTYLYLLIALFALVFIAVGRIKGLKSLLSLVITFVIIIKIIIPQILLGRDPFLVSLIGGLLILIIIIYLTEGFQKKSHLSILAVTLSLSLTLILSIIFTNLTRLTGMSQEEAVFLIGLGEATINFKGLLLAGILIGTIGVLDDIIIGQIETVTRIREANPKLLAKDVYRLAYKIGNTHLGTMVNTLFLTYAGAALPLLLIFSIGESSGINLSRDLNSELITTEIVRTLVGAIGVIASMPIATALGAFGLSKWTKNEK